MKKWYSYIILALVCIGFASCQDSDTVPPTANRRSGERALADCIAGETRHNEGQRHEALRMAVRMIQLRTRRH